MINGLKINEKQAKHYCDLVAKRFYSRVSGDCLGFVESVSIDNNGQYWLEAPEIVFSGTFVSPSQIRFGDLVVHSGYKHDESVRYVWWSSPHHRNQVSTFREFCSSVEVACIARQIGGDTTNWDKLRSLVPFLGKRVVNRRTRGYFTVSRVSIDQYRDPRVEVDGEKLSLTAFKKKYAMSEDELEKRSKTRCCCCKCCAGKE